MANIAKPRFVMCVVLIQIQVRLEEEFLKNLEAQGE